VVIVTPRTSPKIVIGACVRVGHKKWGKPSWEVALLLVLLSVAVILEVVLQALGNSRMYARWPATALASAIGGYAASELAGALSAGAWEWDGLAVVPGVLGVVITGALVDVVLRKVSA
jgi:hypothetical protein